MSSVNSMRTEVTEYDRISLCNGYFFAALASVGWSRCGDTKQLIYRSTNEDWWSTLLNKAYDLWNTGITSGCSDSVDACDGAGNPALICQRLVGGNIVYNVLFFLFHHPRSLSLVLGALAFSSSRCIRPVTSFATSPISFSTARMSLGSASRKLSGIREKS